MEINRTIANIPAIANPAIPRIGISPHLGGTFARTIRAEAIKSAEMMIVTASRLDIRLRDFLMGSRPMCSNSILARPFLSWSRITPASYGRSFKTSASSSKVR